LTCEEDHVWLKNLLKLKVSGDENNPGFGMEWITVVPGDRLVYGDFMTGMYRCIYVYTDMCVYISYIFINIHVFVHVYMYKYIHIYPYTYVNKHA
jgi:hypothetical protein